MACNSQSQLDLQYSTNAEYTRLKLPFMTEFQRRVTQGGCKKIGIDCKRRARTTPNWIVPGSVLPDPYETGPEASVPYMGSRDTFVARGLNWIGKKGKGRAARLAKNIAKYDAGEGEIHDLAELAGGGIPNPGEDIEERTHDVINKHSIKWSQGQEAERIRLLKYKKRFTCWPDGSGQQLVDLRLMPGVSADYANAYINDMNAKRKGGMRSRRLGDYARISNLSAYCSPGTLDRTVGGGGNASQEADGAMNSFISEEVDGYSINTDSWDDSSQNEDVTSSGLGIRPGLMIDSLGGNGLFDPQITSASSTECTYSRESQYINTPQPPSSRPPSSRPSSTEYYNNDCCKIEPFSTFYTDYSNARNNIKNVPNYYVLNCLNTKKANEGGALPLSYCNNFSNIMNMFISWYMIWLAFSSPIENIAQPPHTWGPVSAKAIFPIPSLTTSENITQTPFPSNIFSLQISCYPLHLFINCYLQGLGGVNRISNRSGAATKIVYDLCTQWLRYLFDNENSGKSNLNNNSMPDRYDSGGAGQEAGEFYFNKDTIFRIENNNIKGNPALSAITNYKPEIILELQKTIASKLDAGNTVVLLVNDPFLTQTWSIYIKKYVSHNQGNPKNGMENSGTCSDKPTEACTVGATGNAGDANGRCRAADGNCIRLNFNVSNTQIIIVAPPYKPEHLLGNAPRYINIILYSLVIKLLHLELLVNPSIWFVPFISSTVPPPPDWMSKWYNNKKSMAGYINNGWVQSGNTGRIFKTQPGSGGAIRFFNNFKELFKRTARWTRNLARGSELLPTDDEQNPTKRKRLNPTGQNLVSERALPESGDRRHLFKRAKIGRVGKVPALDQARALEEVSMDTSSDAVEGITEYAQIKQIDAYRMYGKIIDYNTLNNIISCGGGKLVSLPGKPSYTGLVFKGAKTTPVAGDDLGLQQFTINESICKSLVQNPDFITIKFITTVNYNNQINTVEVLSQLYLLFLVYLPNFNKLYVRQ